MGRLPGPAVTISAAAAVRAAAVTALAAALAACHLYHPTPIASAPPEHDTVSSRELSPRDLTGSVVAWDQAYGDDSLFHPRIIGITANSIGISLARAAHVAVILASRCGPYAAVPGRDLTTRVPAGDRWLPLVPPFFAGCPPSFWRASFVVLASELPMHGQVIQERAQRSHQIEDVMAGRRDRWSMYAVYPAR